MMGIAVHADTVSFPQNASGGFLSGGGFQTSADDEECGFDTVMFQDIQYFFRQWRRPVVESKINRVGRNRSFRRQPCKQARIFFLIREGIRRRPFHGNLEFPVLFNLDRTARCRNTDLPEPDDRQYGKKQDNDKDRCIQMPEKTDASPVGFVHRDNLCKSE